MTNTTSPRRHTHWLLIPALSLGACAEPDSSALPNNGSFDVLHQSIDRAERLDLERVWRVGQTGDPSGIEFFRAWAVARSDAGETFVLEAGNHRIDVFDDEGVLVRQFGGEGDGPGEFRGASFLSVRRDTVLVSDQRQRVHFFRTDGTHLATHQLRFPDTDVDGLGPLIGTPEGWLVGAVGYFRDGGTDLPPLQRTHLFHLDPATGDLEPAGLRWQLERRGQFHGIFWIQPILAHRPAAGLDGLGRYLTADTASYRINAYDSDGTHLFRVENEAEATPIDGDLIDLWKESRNCPAGAEEVMECSQERDELALSMPRTEHRPFVWRLRAHPSGHFSISRADVDPNPFDPESTLEYDHFDPNGHFLGSTSGMIPMWFDGETMVSLERDEMGVESVVRYEVEERR